MSYEMFLENLLETTQHILGEGYHVCIDAVVRNNDTRKYVLRILREGMNIAPIIYLDSFYEAYRNGEQMEEICRTLIRCYRRHVIPEHVDPDLFHSWETCRERIVCRLIGRDRNRKRLEHLVSKPFLDMAVIYYYMFPTAEEGMAGTPITKSMLTGWGISVGELDQMAVSNTAALYPPSFVTMDQVMDELLQMQTVIREEPDVSSPLYVLSNTERLHGAYWIRDKKVMEDICAKLHGDGWVLPSSIHECMILPDRIPMDPKEMKSMVWEINRTALDPEEVLTDSVYHYERGRGLAIAGMGAGMV